MNFLTLWMYAQSGQMLFSFKGPITQTTHENVYLAGSLVATIDHAWPSNAVTAMKYQHTDALGSPVAISDASGTIIERTNYDPYGGPIGKTVNGMGYTGHVMDGATGLTYMQQRYYDPGIGRFLSVDPVTASPVNGGNFNRFKYAANNPYGFVDPDGRLDKVTGSNISGNSVAIAMMARTAAVPETFNESSVSFVGSAQTAATQEKQAKTVASDINKAGRTAQLAGDAKAVR